MISKIYYKIILFLLFSTLVFSQDDEEGEIINPCENSKKEYINEIIKCGNNQKCLDELKNKEVGKTDEMCENNKLFRDCNKDNLFKICSDKYIGGNIDSTCGIYECNELIKNKEVCKTSICSCSKWTPNDTICKP